MSDSGIKFQAEPRGLTRAAVLHPVLRHGPGPVIHHGPSGSPQQRDRQAALNEAIGLARAIDLQIVIAEPLTVSRPRPSHLFGKGRTNELGERLRAEHIELAIVNGTLTPVQQRNLERDWGLKVLDRTGLILEIFGRRARTREGRLQVELAHLTYQKSRLVRTWTHLERQRGGLGFVGGPGETQIEADRRLIQERINKLEKLLIKVTRTRKLHRKSRQKVPFSVVALVGYTNAGKSTLFNYLTKAQVDARDQVFATLDPTMREVALPHGVKVILSDTVGFISDLPTDLVASFRATLEEVLEADLIVHVRDIVHDESAVQALDVRQVLDALEIEDARLNGMLEVWNKLDLADAETRAAIAAHADRQENVVALSAATGENIERFLEMLVARIGANSEKLSVVVDGGQGAEIHWLHENCQVLNRQSLADGSIAFRLRVPVEKRSRFDKMFPDVEAGMRAAE